ncbi:hypothetical protein M1D58_27500 (plasmid) [Pseudomonas sp. R4-76]|uniref:hypothetical protein n=1 Tax=unclassified Pseudomonas TaxID=196821 RepID=UPI003DA952FB
MPTETDDLNLNQVLQERFSAGQGVVTLSPSLTDAQILQLIKSACRWSQGAAFQVVPAPVTHAKVE